MISRFRFAVALLLVAMMALALRLVGIDWDKDLYLHPDERFIVWVTTDLRWPESIGSYFNTGTSPLNPYNTEHGSFVYGTFPSFLVKAVAGIFGMDSYGELHLVGRAVSAVADTGTVVLAALIGRRFFGQRVGLLAGLFLAFTPLMIQTSHFFTVDTIATFFATAAFLCAVKSWDASSVGWMACAGLMVGLAGASKPNFLVTIVFIGLPLLELVRQQGWSALRPSIRERVYPALPAVVTGGMAAIITFRIAQPYAFAGPNWWNLSLNQAWLDDLAYWRAVQTGLVDMKPSIQWIDRTPVLYILQNLVFWGMGLFLGVAALIGLTLALVRIVRSDRWPCWFHLGMVGWCIANILLYGTGIAQNQRYLIQIYPFLAIFAAAWLIEIRDKIQIKWIANALLAGVAVYTVVYGVAFASLYVRPITRIQASEWIYENIPAGSTLSNEYWDDALPMQVPGYDRSLYESMTLDLYADESQPGSKVTTLVGQLSQVDYVVLSSNRIIDSVARQPERYPVANRFYAMLLSGELGFEEIKDFTQGPELFGIEWNDLSAEESLTVYEHPQVRIFKKTDAFDAQHVSDEFNTALANGAFHYIPGDPLPNQMLLSHDQVSTANSHGTWTQQFGDGFVQQHPLLFWWLAMQCIALAAWPLTWRAFRKTPDAGAALSKAVGLFSVTTITLGLVSWGQFVFGRGAIAGAIIIVLALSLVSLRGHAEQFWSSLRLRAQSIVLTELVFAAALLAVGWMRTRQAITPNDELAQFTSVVRSSDLPPLDLLFSGGVLHTFWAAILPWATISRLLGVSPAPAFVLSSVGAMALTAVLVWSVSFALIRNRLAVIVPVLVVFASGTGFTAGVVSLWFSDAIKLTTLAILPLVATMLCCLICRHRSDKLTLVLAGGVAGCVMAAAEWGPILAAVILLMGLAVPEWQNRVELDAWWPAVRRFVFEFAAMVVVGLLLWFPAISAHTSTARDMVSPSAWTFAYLSDFIGPVMFLATLLIAIGAAIVLGDLFAEGRAGLVTAFVVLMVIVSVAAIAIVVDSALLMVFVVSLLGLISACHWMRDHVMAWCVGLVLASMLLLAVAQTRPSHVGIADTIATKQLLPVIWMLLAVAVGIGGIRLTTNAKGSIRSLAAIGLILVTAILLLPVLGQVRDAESRSTLANPTVLAPTDEMAAARWLQTQPFMPVVLSIPDVYSGISVLSGQPSFAGSVNFALKTRPGWDSMVYGRNDQVARMYSLIGDWPSLEPMIQRYGIRFVIVGPAERQYFGPTLDKQISTSVEVGHLELVWQQGDFSIYQIIIPAKP